MTATTNEHADVSVDDLALRLVAIKVLKDALEAEDASLRAELSGRMRVGARAMAELPDGTPVGAVTRSRPRAARAKVVDVEAFTAWVAAAYPSEVVHHEQVIVPARDEVRASFAEKLLADVVKTGELPDGVEMGEPGRPGLSVPKLPAGAPEAIVDAFRRGQLTPLLALGTAA